jgi:hypothetical protein
VLSRRPVEDGPSLPHQQIGSGVGRQPADGELVNAREHKAWGWFAHRGGQDQRELTRSQPDGVQHG